MPYLLRANKQLWMVYWTKGKRMKENKTTLRLVVKWNHIKSMNSRIISCLHHEGFRKQVQVFRKMLILANDEFGLILFCN